MPLSWQALTDALGTPLIRDLLPVPYKRTYVVGGNKIIRDAVGTNFNPHFWLFELGTAVWRVGYDQIQKPTYEITMEQISALSVLLVDYWQPPLEIWRQDQSVLFPVVSVSPQDGVPMVVSGSPDVVVDVPSGIVDLDGYVQTGAPG